MIERSTYAYVIESLLKLFVKVFLKLAKVNFFCGQKVYFRELSKDPIMFYIRTIYFILTSLKRSIDS